MSAVGNIISGSVSRVTFKSQLTPDFEYDPSAPSSPPSGGGSWLLKLVKPAAYVETPLGVVPVEPYGTPTEDYFPFLVTALALVAVGFAWLIRRAAR